MNPGISGRWSKVRRTLTSISTPDLLAALAVVVATVTIGATLTGGSANPQTMQLFWLAMKAGLVIALLLVVILVVKTRLEYRRRTYDPTVILVFQKQFDEMDDDNIRKDAANVCGRYLELPDTDDEKYRWLKIEDDDRDKLEPVLDFFEDLGFYLAGDQFSDEVTHHHFFHWIRGYYSILKPYIDYYRDKENEKATYVFIEQLYERVCEIEKTFPTVKLLLDTKIEKLEFLRDERQSGNAE